MAAAKANTRGRDRVTEYHKEFAAAIIKQIEAGTAPWQRPWKPGEQLLPRNPFTGNRYTGGNALGLALEGAQRGFADHRWATYRQIKEAGGHVRKGERGAQILYFQNQKLVAKKDDQGRQLVDSDGRTVYERPDKPRLLVRVYTVFNAEQAEGLDLPPRDAAAPEWQRHQAAEAVIETSNVPIKHAPGNRAYYSSRADQIVLPERRQFPSAEHYYATALHELSHASGHKSRMDRETFHNAVKYPTGGFGSAPYAREELRAEIAAMMTGERIGIGHHPQDGHCGNSAAYVESWIKALKDDPREIYRAAAEATRISDFLMKPARERIQEIGQDKPSSPDAAEIRVPALTPPAPARQQPAMTPGR